MIKIAIINESSAATDAQIAQICAAVQIQVSRDFAPAWGIDAIITAYAKGQTPPPGAWYLVVSDTADEAGTLGYHDLTPEGLPLGKVFAQTILDRKQSLSISISHEVLEMISDSDISTLTHYQTNERNLFIAREVCDPCGADKCGYIIMLPKKGSECEMAPGTGWCITHSQTTLACGGGDMVPVSDFVYPAWFHNYAFGLRPVIGVASALPQNLTQEVLAADDANKVRFDHAGMITAPFQFLEDGYIRAFDLNTCSWRDITDGALNAPRNHAARAAVGSRRERRCIPRTQWLKSKGEAVIEAKDAMRELLGQ
jgi:hypothetical protein